MKNSTMPEPEINFEGYEFALGLQDCGSMEFTIGFAPERDTLVIEREDPKGVFHCNGASGQKYVVDLREWLDTIP